MTSVIDGALGAPSSAGPADGYDAEALSALARRHLWGHFTRLSAGAGPVMVHGEGVRVWDATGKRYLDGLSGLFTVQAGHGRRELADAAAKQGAELGYFPIWSYAHPPAIALAARLAELAPGDLNRVFFTVTGGEAVETAWKLARQYFKMTGQAERYKVISRQVAYHGATMGALAVTGITALKTPFEPGMAGSTHVPWTNPYRCTTCALLPGCTLWCADEVERAILQAGPETVAMVALEPVQNGGGCFPPPVGYFQRVREICDRYGVLLLSDEVICSYGRLGYMFGAERYDYQPDMISTAKGLTSGYSPLGALLVSDRLAEPFTTGDATFMHGATFGGHPVSCAVGLANLDIFEREDLFGHVRANESIFRSTLEDALGGLPIVGEIRGAGYFYGIELVKDRDTRETFDEQECEDLLRGFLSKRLLEAGLVCRADDRGDPVIQLAPPLISGPAEFTEIADILRTVLGEAWQRVGRS